MIDTEALRKKVIDLAIQGKLTEQLPSDGDAETLYAQIQEEKAMLVKEGKIKKDKPLPEIADDEIPFDIPENWRWVRFATIITLQSGQDLNATDYNSDENGIPYITGASNYRDDGTLIINRWTDSPKAFANRGDILLSCKGTVGKLTILEEEEVHIARQIMGIRTYSVNKSFIKFFIDCMLERIKSASKGLIPGIERNDILNLCCPLPSVEEQQRIVTRIESVLAEIDIIDDLQEKYRNDLATLKSKIIDAGIRGKLTEQFPEDGDAETLYAQIQEEKAKLIKEGKIKKEKPLGDITDDEIPFEIPKNWKWVRLGNVLNEVIVPQRDKPKRFDGDIPWCRIEDADGDYMSKSHSNQNVSRETIEEMNLRVFPTGTVLSACSGASIGRILITTTELCTNQTFNGLVCSSGLNNRYLFHFLRNSIGKLKKLGSGAAMEYVSQKKTNEMLLPLPPYDEQKRIVERMDELLLIAEQ